MLSKKFTTNPQDFSSHYIKHTIYEFSFFIIYFANFLYLCINVDVLVF